MTLLNDFLDRLSAYLQSAIVRQQLGALILATAALFGFAPDGEILGQSIEKIIAAMLAVIPVITLLARIFKPAPNLSATAVKKEQQLRASGKITANGSINTR